MNWKRLIITWIVVAVGLYTVSQFFFKSKKSEPPKEGISITTNRDSYSIDQEVIVVIKNGLLPASYEFACPKNPFLVLNITVTPPAEVSAETKTPCENIPQKISLATGETQKISMTHWNHALFGQPGRFRIEIPFLVDGKETKIVSTQEFEITERGMLKNAWYHFFYRPLYNGLVFLTDIIPGKTLAMGIILLTIIIRLILLVPSQHALRSQKKMQEIQPKLNHIKEKYAGNQEMIAKETMEIWKKEKVNPFGSCLPLLIQFPVLIALFYVIRQGLTPDSAYLLYEPLKSVDFLKIGTSLFTLDLTKVNTIILPLIVGLLQFIQMKLAMAKKPTVSTGGKGSEMEMANSMMLYVLPVMIALFTASAPGGVGLYWGISTMFSIGQQLWVNREFQKQPA